MELPGLDVQLPDTRAVVDATPRTAYVWTMSERLWQQDEIPDAGINSLQKTMCSWNAPIVAREKVMHGE